MINLHACLNGQVRRLSHIRRYSTYSVHRPENVADHSWHVAFATLVIARDLQHRGFPVDAGAALARAIVHDVSEALSGDIIRSYKYSTPEMEAATHDADRLNMSELVEAFGPVGPYMFNRWMLAKDSSNEGRIVALADVLSVMTYCAEEHLGGNLHLDGVMRKAYESLLRPLRDDAMFGIYIRDMFPNDSWRDAIYYTPEEA